MKTQIKNDAPSQGEAASQESKQKMRTALESDLRVVSALIQFIQTTPAVIDLLVDYAEGQRINAMNKAQATKPE